MMGRRSYFFRLDDDLLRGTFAPALRACDNPIAMACLRLLTFLPERPLVSVPRFRSCIAFSTFSEAFLPYFAIVYSFREVKLTALTSALRSPPAVPRLRLPGPLRPGR